MVPWKKRYLEVVQGANKEKAYIVRKSVLKFQRKIIQTRRLNLQTQVFGNNIYHRTRKIIQKHFPNFKLSKTVRL